MEQQPSDRGGEPDSGPRVQRFQFGPWLFNVNGARAIIAESPRQPQALPVPEWAHFYGLDNTDESVSLFSVQVLDRDYAMTTDLDEPVLVAMMRSSPSRQFPLLIDGTHRLYHAYVECVAELPAYVLTVEESLAIREDDFIHSSVHWPSPNYGRLLKSPDEHGNSGE